MTDPTTKATDTLAFLVSAHVAMLGSQGLIDDAAVSVITGVIDRVRAGASGATDPLEALIELDALVDAQSPPGFAGASRVGRGTNELVAAFARVTLRNQLLALDHDLNHMRADLLDLAAQHAVTIMPAYQQGLAAQPTTLAHFLGGLIGPLGRTHEGLMQTYSFVNRSPLGAGALAATGLPIDRSMSAANAGFDEPIENTFDAVSAVDYFADVAYAIDSIVLPVDRFMREVRTMYRTEPSALLMHDASPRHPSELPQHRVIPAFGELDRMVTDVQGNIWLIQQWTKSAELEPLSELAQPLQWAALAFAGTHALIERFLVFLNREIAFNRAYLANRSNRNHATIGELTDFLMLEEQIPPAQAHAMTDRVMAQLREQEVETSAITSAMIDSSAMLILGREIGVEFEALSKYLAPRRFIERRSLPGGPAPMAVRSWLTEERERLDKDKRWTEERQQALAEAELAMRALAEDEQG